MKAFILDRTDDRATKSRRQIATYAVLFFVATRLACMPLMAGVAACTQAVTGTDPISALQFGGSPEVAAKMGWAVFPMILLLAPLFEECCFRLGLSFRRNDAAIGLGALTVFLVSRFASPWWAVPAGAAAAAAVRLSTGGEWWAARRERWLRPAAWASAVLFGLAHLFAMPGLTPALLPAALTICTMLFFAGCTFVYLRMNLGFRWAVAGHMICNIPAAIQLIMEMQ